MADEGWPAPAVGEKKREEFLAAVGVVARLVRTVGLLGVAARWSIDMLWVECKAIELAPKPVFESFASDGASNFSFALLTLRCNDQATRPRQRSTAAPIAPNIAPTQMKTVPSGRFELYINGAPAVYGTTMVGMP